MNSSATRPLHVAIRCDALAHEGLGHLVRQTALVEELRARGHVISLYGSCDVPWAAAQAAKVGLEFCDVKSDFAAQLIEAGCDSVVVDGYAFPPALGRSLREAGFPVLTMVDGDFGRHQEADVYVDQNLGSDDPGFFNWLVGPQYALLRDVVLARRGAERVKNSPPKALVVFGGSDPFGGAPIAVELLLSLNLPIHVVAIAASSERRAQMEGIRVGSHQILDIVGAQDDLPGLAMTCDFVVSAAGSSVWEFACLGVPTALICVTDNQQVGYSAVTQTLAVPVGLLEQLRFDRSARESAKTILERLVSDPAWRESLGARGKQLIDGLGRSRVADALEAKDPMIWNRGRPYAPQSVGPHWVLGTVQLGIDYGAANDVGQPSVVEARRLLQIAVDSGVTELDTARAYGTSEEVVGFALHRGLEKRVSVVTKLLPLNNLPHDAPPESAAAAVETSLCASRAALGPGNITTLLTHRWDDWSRASGGVANELQKLQQSGVVQGIGVSLSTPEELLQALGDDRVNYVQLPFNLLDRRWLEASVQAALKQRSDVVIAVRSVFLQGLLARPRQARWPAVQGVDEIQEALDQALVATGSPTHGAMALGYVRSMPFVHRIVLGAESAWQVNDQAELWSMEPLTPEQVDEVHRLVPAGPLELVNPALW